MNKLCCHLVPPNNDIYDGDSTSVLNNNQAASKPPSPLYLYPPLVPTPELKLSGLASPPGPDLDKEYEICTDVA